MTDRRHLRAAHADRERVAEQLRVAVVEGRIDLDELNERIDLTYAARTLGELELVVADLPADGEVAAAGLELHTVDGNIRQEGRWLVPSRISARVGLGGRVRIDFTAADCVHREVVVDIDATSWFGDIVIVVPRGWKVDDTEVVRLTGGSVHNLRGVNLAPDGVVVRLTGQVKTGDVWVRYRKV
ncbi:DUF1707 domain-containing protein [Herbidospora galbida]|uniref:DUF1707 domain-containing protein n=1 Tax=Herbidospora galbida TaxID=2575442 RepID=A0A4U3LYS2_9ACTN|nr:DUF1707 domain-containing protein [Herbidospora galbida]TKK80769.1 DUF1707 domain-containing protein [Herbidospora galbida]